MKAMESYMYGDPSNCVDRIRAERKRKEKREQEKKKEQTQQNQGGKGWPAYRTTRY